MSVEDPQTCPECGSENVQSATDQPDEYVCSDCGFVIRSSTDSTQDSDEPEWRAFVTEKREISIENNEEYTTISLKDGKEEHKIDIYGDRKKYAINIDDDGTLTLKIANNEPDYYITIDADRLATRSGKKLEARERGMSIWLKTERHLNGIEGAGYSFRPKGINKITVEKKENVGEGGIFSESTSPITIFEKAPGKGGYIYWIYEVEDPKTVFSDCQTQEEVSDQLKTQNINTDEQITTCRYTLVLESPEDPHKPVSPPEKPVIIEVIKRSFQDRKYEFYQIDDPVSTFGDAWGDTHAMYDAIIKESHDPLLEYDNVSLIFQRSYGEL